MNVIPLSALLLHVVHVSADPARTTLLDDTLIFAVLSNVAAPIENARGQFASFNNFSDFVDFL
jgi:hypothetical protein